MQELLIVQVTAATCSFMVLFSSTMSSMQFLLLGMDQVNSAIIFSIICFIASVIGLGIVQKLIKKYGRSSLIVFSVGSVMALSTILITSFGVVDAWRDYHSGKYMGFKPPCWKVEKRKIDAMGFGKLLDQIIAR